MIRLISPLFCLFFRRFLYEKPGLVPLAKRLFALQLKLKKASDIKGQEIPFGIKCENKAWRLQILERGQTTNRFLSISLIGLFNKNKNMRFFKKVGM